MVKLFHEVLLVWKLKTTQLFRWNLHDMLFFLKTITLSFKNKKFLSQTDYWLSVCWCGVNKVYKRIFLPLFSFKDADKLGGGYVLVFIYVNLMLSKMNFVQQRFWLSVVGIVRWDMMDLVVVSHTLVPVSPWGWSWATDSAPCSACSTPQPTQWSPSFSSALELTTSLSSPRHSPQLVGQQRLTVKEKKYRYHKYYIYSIIWLNEWPGSLGAQ